MAEEPKKRLVDTDPRFKADIARSQYDSIRNEIRGYQQDETALFTNCLVVFGTLVTIAAWQNVVLLLALVPVFVYVSWLKLTSLTTNTFRSAAFLRAVYEEPAKDGTLCWENSLEEWRQANDRQRSPVNDPESATLRTSRTQGDNAATLPQFTSWRNNTKNALRWLVWLPIVAAVATSLKATIDVYSRRNEQLFKLDAEWSGLEIKRQEIAVDAAVRGVSAADARWDAIHAQRQAEINAGEVDVRFWRTFELAVHGGSLLIVVAVSVGCAIWMRGEPPESGSADWRAAALVRFRRIARGQDPLTGLEIEPSSQHSARPSGPAA